MSRKRTLPKAWEAVVNAVGTLDQVAEMLDISPSTFYRSTRGLTKWPAERLAALEVLCDVYDVDNPLESSSLAVARSKDLRPLRMLGDALSRGFPVARRQLAKRLKQYPQVQLIELANSDNTGPEIMAAVQALLEFTPAEGDDE